MKDKPLLEKCPSCRHDLSAALSRYFWGSLPGNAFEYTCPNCETVLNIHVEPQPLFYVTKATKGGEE